jgi:hypothetical protein
MIYKLQINIVNGKVKIGDIQEIVEDSLLKMIEENKLIKDKDSIAVLSVHETNINVCVAYQKILLQAFGNGAVEMLGILNRHYANKNPTNS